MTNLIYRTNINKNNLVVFIKHPTPGMVKTRLAKDIGNLKAAEVYSHIAETVLKNCINPNSYTTTIYYYPSNTMDSIKRWIKLEVKGIRYMPQRGKDLGHKMLNAVRQSIRNGFDKTVLIGSDCIDLNSLIIEEAFNSLNNNEVVIGPSTDGGYYLIGLRKPFDFIFNGIRWSTNTVYSDTVSILRCNKIRYGLLKSLNDIDTLYDLEQNEHLSEKFTSNYTNK